MKSILFICLFFSMGTQAARLLNCHTDEAKIGNDLFRSYDISFPMKDSNQFEDSAKLYENSFPFHPVDPNPFIQVSTQNVEIKDSLWGGNGELLLYFRARNVNYVLNLEKEREEKLVGTLKKQGMKGLTLAARCYLFPTFP